MGTDIEQMTSLRNERKPCHFWVDNEVADCYQPIVGADAIWVYCRIARYANGAWIVSPRLRGTSDTRVGLREMAEWCGKSVDTVSRSLEVLELVGLLRAERGPGKSKGRYALADVKDLVQNQGGFWDRSQGGFRLPDARAKELAEAVRILRLKLSRKSPLRIVEAEEAEPAESLPQGTSVAQSDRWEPGQQAVETAQSDRSVAPDVQICASRATAINCIEKARQQELKATPPTPSLRDGDEVLNGECDAGKKEKSAAAVGDDVLGAGHAAGVDADAAQAPAGGGGGGMAAAVDQVCAGIGLIANRRKRELLRAVIALRVKAGESPPEVAALMIRRWQRQAELGAFLRVKLGPQKFFGEGYWEDERRWFWDEEKWRLHCESRAGSL